MTDSGYWTWFNNRVAEAMATDDGKRFADAGMEIVHTGGGCVGWAINYHPEQAHVLVTDDDGTGLFTTPDTQAWIVSMYDRDGEYLESVVADDVADAIRQAHIYQAELNRLFPKKD